jgi:NAD(P)-dependent dehydrogenase (short-subunit alcohol dehydrogenase family)
MNGQTSAVFRILPFFIFFFRILLKKRPEHFLERTQKTMKGHKTFTIIIMTAFTKPPTDPGSYLQSLLQLENKTALVTGSTSGLGRSVAEALVRAGVKVAINGRDKERTEKACAEIAQACVPLSLQAGAPRVVVAYGDTSSDDEAQQAVDQTVNAFGGSIDILINNAGINLPEDTFEAQTLEQWDQISAVNIGGPIRITKAALPHLKKSHAGRIINFASILGHVGGPSNTMYTMTKAAMLLFSKSLAAELANTSITVNSISPGVMATRMNSKFEADKKTKGNVEKLIPMGRFGTPDEVVGAVLFFSSDASSYCTGSDILVDGGFTSV